MLDNKQVTYGLLAVGALIAFFSVVIDPLRGHDVYMSDSQALVLAAGLVLALMGAYLIFISEPITDTRVAYALLVQGALVILFSAAVDPLRGHDIHVGAGQIAILIVGLGFVAAGIHLAFMHQTSN